LNIRNSPCSPTTRALIRISRDDHIEQLIRPVCPPSKTSYATMARSIFGVRNVALAQSTSGVEPPKARAMWTA
jgi:hypothetical protein